MSSTNQSPQYLKAQARFLQAQTDTEKLLALEEMIRECPKHKSSESMLANLKTRRKKLLEKIEKRSRKSKSSKHGIKKESMQTVIIGKTNSGKSTLMSLLTNTKPEISPYGFTTKNPVVGMIDYSGTQIQLIENPAIESEYYDKGLTHSTDTLLIVVNKLEEVNEILELLRNMDKKKIIIFNIKEDLDERKLDATLKSKKLNYFIINLKEKIDIKNEDNIIEEVNINYYRAGGEQFRETKLQNSQLAELRIRGVGGGVELLKEKIFQSFSKIRVFTKEPGKPKSERPVILDPESKIKDLAEKLHKKFIEQFKFSRVWGPSAKFGGMVCGLNHVLKDNDIVELHTS